MNNFIKLSILLCLTALISSCDKDETDTTEETVVVFKKITTSSSQNRNPEFEEIEVVVTSFDPLVIESEEMEVESGISTETDNFLQITSFKDSDYYSKNTASKNSQPRTRSGWLYNASTDCFYYGTYTFHDNGSVTFTYADIATQVLMNVCGGTNDPFTQSGFARNSN